MAVLVGMQRRYDTEQATELSPGSPAGCSDR